MSDTLSIVLFSGTEDKLHAAATLAVGAVAMDRPVNVLLMYWALDAFRADRIANDHGLAYDAARPALQRAGRAGRRDPVARDVPAGQGDRRDDHPRLLGLARGPRASTSPTLDPLVDSSGGIATFLVAAEGGQILFI